MNDSIKDKGISQVLLQRFAEFRLPRLLEIKEQLDAGGKLSNLDAEFLEEAIEDAQENKHFADDNPEVQALFAKTANLYTDITSKALDNEKKG